MPFHGRCEMINPRDREAQGDPEWIVCLPEGVLLGLCVRGLRGGPVVLGIREDAEGAIVSCAILLDFPTPRRQADRWCR